MRRRRAGFLGRPRPMLRGKLAPLLRIIGRHHRIVGLETERLAISVWREFMLDGEVPLQQLLLLAADQANEMVWSDGAAHSKRPAPASSAHSI